MIIPVEQNNNCFLFETCRVDEDNYRSWYFFDPVAVLRLTDPHHMGAFFDELQAYSESHYAAGFFSYELGLAFEERLRPFLAHQGDDDFPLALFGVYKRALIYDHHRNRFVDDGVQFPEHPDYRIGPIGLAESESAYREKIHKIHGYIYDGEIYQVNYTTRFSFDFSGSPLGLYNDLKLQQPVSYAACARFDDFHAISISPELFFRKNGPAITVKPMKGTIGRGRTNREDDRLHHQLHHDIKNRSENLMIVDLLRNDLSRISEPGSVLVRRLFDIEKYRTLFQMTSTVEGRLSAGVSVYDLIKALFPCGSITGAPKIRSMEIIHELEERPRGLYTGALGFFAPQGQAVFNVAIRTVLIRNGRGEMGVGGGIVYDSTPESEYAECRLKGNFLTSRRTVDFQLIETMRYNGDFERLELHLDRLWESARYFDYPFDESAIRSALDELRPALIGGEYRVRLLLGNRGDIKITPTLLDQTMPQTYAITIASRTTDSADPMLYHKTTDRALYADELARARAAGFFDAVFMNERGEITEGAITNVYAKIDGQICTPPVTCGLLDGTMRRHLLIKDMVRERMFTLDELLAADACYISNAIIGFQPAIVKPGSR